jgi:hypothetical protein
MNERMRHANTILRWYDVTAIPFRAATSPPGRVEGVGLSGTMAARPVNRDYERSRRDDACGQANMCAPLLVGRYKKGKLCISLM